MHKEAHGNDLEDEFEGKYVTEDLADLLKVLIVRRLVLSVTEVCAGENERVQENCQHNERFEAVAVRQAHHELAEACFVMEQEERAAIIHHNVWLRNGGLIPALASVKEGVSLQVKDALDEIGRLINLLFLLHEVSEDHLVSSRVIQLADHVLQSAFLLLFKEYLVGALGIHSMDHRALAAFSVLLRARYLTSFAYAAEHAGDGHLPFWEFHHVWIFWSQRLLQVDHFVVLGVCASFLLLDRSTHD